jgi:hypothetical protein
MKTMHDLESAIRAAKRLGVRPPLTLVRHQKALHYLQGWQRKAKLAATKVKCYRRKVRYYEAKGGAK